MRFLIALALIVGGVYVASRSFFVARFFGQMKWAERNLGAGGTYTAWKLIGIGACIGGLWLLFNDPF